MHFFKRRFYRRGNIWRWFLVTILPASLPFIVSIITSANRLSGDFGEYIRIDELIFMGLSVNISSLNTSLVKIPAALKDKAMFLSVTYLLVLSFCLGSSYSNDKLSLVGVIDCRWRSCVFSCKQPGSEFDPLLNFKEES